MTTVTLEAIKAEHSRLADLIASFEKASASRMIRIADTELALNPDEVYAGLILNEDGTPSHHIILLPGETSATWDDAKKWAAKSGGELPTRREQALLFANAKREFKEVYYWSSEAHTNGSGAWVQHFNYRYQGTGTQKYELCARAVRRVSA